jgi:hypothetical protein
MTGARFLSVTMRISTRYYNHDCESFGGGVRLTALPLSGGVPG